jgi:predicted RNA-binding protein YlxR (DUF448 family)
MLRIASLHGGTPVVDVKACAPGRGAYLCRQRSCLDKALKRRGIERTLKLTTTIPASMRDEIARLLEANVGPNPALGRGEPEA